MARNRNRLTLKQILNTDIADVANLAPQEIRSRIQTMADAVNKRIKRFQKAGIESPAVRQMYESGGRISTKGLADDELTAEYRRAMDFLTNRTSSIKEFEKIRKETQEEFAKKGIVLTKEDFYKISSIYQNLKDTNPEIAAKGFKYFARGQFHDVVYGGATSLERAIARMEDMLDIESGEFDDISDFFDL